MRVIILAFFFLSSISFAQTNYTLHCSKKLLEASKDSALLQLGIVEKTGKNDAPEIEKYLKSTFTAKGNPYCAAAVYWCFFSAAIELKIPIAQIPIKRTALANAMFNDAAKRGAKAKYIPSEHSLIVWKYPNSCFGHIERIVSVGKAGWVETIAFNVSAFSNEHGKEMQGVFLKKRNIYHALGKMRIRGMISFAWA
ncbi:MAG: hypothetical protein GX121_10570 [Ignavibacteria bacterium]|nr:hypothetical protein [Ignavibacteria bacterium]